MSSPPIQIPRFKSIQDWFNFFQTNPQVTGADLYRARVIVYREIEKLRERPLIVYYASLAVPKGVSNFIDVSDIDGFTDLVNSIPSSSKSIDVLIHSPGGLADITERIAAILYGKFAEVHYLIPHSAYSAATMLALSGDSITMHPSATLGPIDPQFDGSPARSITKGFEKAKEKIMSEGPSALPAYLPLIQKYSLHLLEQCADYDQLSKTLIRDWLNRRMLKGKSEKEVEEVVDFFSNYETHLTHSRPILFEKLKRFGLNISVATTPLDGLLWELYVHWTGFTPPAGFYKLFENSTGISWGRQNIVQVQQLGQQPGQPLPQP